MFDALVINKLNVLELIQRLLHKDKSLEVSPQRFCSLCPFKQSCTKRQTTSDSFVVAENSKKKVFSVSLCDDIFAAT